jgi:hypothetical protein
MRGGGTDDVSATALSGLALVRSGGKGQEVQGALRWLAARRDPSGTWGTTTPTVMALKALLAGSGAPVRRDREATITVSLAEGSAPGGKTHLGALRIRPEQSDAVQAVRLEGIDRPGTYRLRLAGRGAAGMAWQLATRYSSLTGAGKVAAGSPLAVSVEYDRTDLAVGGTVAACATVANRAGAAAHMLVVDLGTPPGFAVRPDGLEQLRQQGKIQRYTLTGRGIIVYIERLAPGASLEIRYDLVARMPLSAVAAPGQVYSYYNPDQMAASKPVLFRVR